MYPDGIVDVPGAEQASPTQLARARHHLEAADRALQKGRQAGECGLSKLARSRIFIVLQPLEPDPGADLMSALADLEVVGIGEEIAAIPDARGIIRTRGSDTGK